MGYVVALSYNSYRPITKTASSTTKTGRHDIAEILLKVALNTIKIKNQITKVFCILDFCILDLPAVVP